MTIVHWINGEAASGGARSQPVFDPATGQSRQEVQLADRATVERAIAAAERAYPAWRDTPPLKRARIMLKLKTLLEQHADAICRLITAEHGKVHGDAMGELQRGIENIEYAGYAPELLKGEHGKDAGPGIDSWSEFQPLGVAAGITPFNFPAMVPLWMWPMAVVCGNTFVLKPSERVPSSTLYIARLASEAGLPPGVLNVVNGDREAWKRCCMTIASRPSASSARRRWLSTSITPAAARTNGCRRWAAPRIMRWCCRTPISPARSAR